MRNSQGVSFNSCGELSPKYRKSVVGESVESQPASDPSECRQFRTDILKHPAKLRTFPAVPRPQTRLVQGDDFAVLSSYSPELRYLCRFLKVGVLECGRHPINFGVVDRHLLGDRAPLRDRAARLPDDFLGD